MHYTLEIVLREQNEATSERIHHAGNPPEAWTEADVMDVLKTMLLAIDRRRRPRAGDDRYVALRGFSWIVEPSEGGVVIAIEIASGAAVAGPFAIAQVELDRLVRSVIAAAAPARPTVH
jgi:hypothetical protein